MFVSKATPKTYSFTFICVLLVLLAGLSFAGDKNENRGYLGVMLQDINSSLAEAMDLDSKNGVLVSSVIEDGPAEKAGLLDGDVIIKFQGENLDDYKDLTKAVRSTSVGEEVEVVVLRDGKEKTINVELGERTGQKFMFYGDDGDFHSSHGNIKLSHGDGEYFTWNSDSDNDVQVIMKKMAGMKSDRGFMGIELDDISDQMGDYFDVEDGKGALITSVNEDSAADEAGLKAGDVIVKMGDEDIESASDVHSALSDTKADEDLDIRVVRNGKNKSINITLGELPEDQMITHLEMMNDGNSVFDIRSPKMLFHGMPRAPHAPDGMLRDIRIITEGDEELKEMRSELDEMKKDLAKMRKELKNR